MIEGRVSNMSQEAKAEFEELDLKLQLMEVINAHTPSEMKMVYTQVCLLLSVKPSTDFFKNATKGKDGLEEMIWNNLRKLRHIWNK